MGIPGWLSVWMCMIVYATGSNFGSDPSDQTTVLLRNEISNGPTLSMLWGVRCCRFHGHGAERPAQSLDELYDAVPTVLSPDNAQTKHNKPMFDIVTIVWHWHFSFLSFMVKQTKVLVLQRSLRLGVAMGYREKQLRYMVPRCPT